MILNNKKLVTFLEQKDLLVESGRKISKQIEKVERQIQSCEDKEKVITAKVQPKELGEKAEALKAQINELVKKFEKVASDIQNEKLSAIPKDLEEKHLALLKEKEQLERERNKVALKVQKIKDRVIPLIQKEVKPHLKEYEDIGTAFVKNGEVEVQIYSRLEEWKDRFKSRAI